MPICKERENALVQQCSRPHPHFPFARVLAAFAVFASFLSPTLRAAGYESTSVLAARPLEVFVTQFAETLKVNASEAAPDPGLAGPQAGLRTETAARAVTEWNAAPAFRQTSPLASPWMMAGSGDPVSGASQQRAREDSSNAVRWGPLLRHSAFFLGVQHGFRLATEEGTREGLKGPFFKDWYSSLSSLHGWGDGDPFFVNYIGHPMQGSVSGYIWRQNDPKYSAIEFGNHADYWRSVLRSTAFSFAYSTQFEIGPASEATIGAVQSRYPQQGFVDHVATPTIGAVWMIGEDILDRYLIRRLEGRTENVFLRMMARGWLNPTRSFANMMRFKVPWYRDSRPGIWKYRMTEEFSRREAERSAGEQRRTVPRERSGKAWDEVAPFDFTFSTDYSRHPAGSVGANCIGGGGTAVWNRGAVHSWVAEVSGCKLFTFDPDFSGDILTYRVGPRWTKRSGRWMPYGQMLVGGKRATVENIPEDRREYVREINRLPVNERPPRSEYVDRAQSNGFALSIGGGLDVGLTRAAQLRLANFDYTRAWVTDNSFAYYPNSIRFSMGIVLRVGTW